MCSVENLTICFYNPVLILSSRLRPDLSGALFAQRSGAKKRERRAEKGAHTSTSSV